MSIEFQPYEPKTSSYEKGEMREISGAKSEKVFSALETKYAKALDSLPDGEGREIFERLLTELRAKRAEYKEKTLQTKEVAKQARKNVLQKDPKVSEAPKRVIPEKMVPIVSPKVPKFDDVKAGSSSIAVEPPESGREVVGTVRGVQNKLNPSIPEEKPIEVIDTQEPLTNENEDDKENETKDIFAGSSRVIDEVMGWLKSRFH